MNHGSLFSGIGGFDLAARWMGWNNIFHVERDPFCQKVLKHHFPESESFDDIKEFKATPFLGRLSIFQAASLVSHLVQQESGEGHPTIDICGPKCSESLGSPHPDGSRAKTFMASCLGLKGWYSHRLPMTWRVKVTKSLPVLLPASGVGAPHLRNRIWFCARNADWNTHGKEHGLNTRVQEGSDAQPDGMRSVADSDHAGNADGFGALSGANEEVRQWDHNAESGNTGEGHASHPHGEDRPAAGQ